MGFKNYVVIISIFLHGNTAHCLNHEIASFSNSGENFTLDRVDDIDPDFWKVASTNLKKWFEYYNDTTALQANVNNNSSCGAVISEQLEKLEHAEGIWAACQDPALPMECHATPRFPCHPFLNFQSIRTELKFQTVKLRMYIQGHAIVRIYVGPDSTNCFDVGNYDDVFSKCKFNKLNQSSETGWIEFQTLFNAYDSVTVSHKFVTCNIK